jgi:D-alanyl-D-alanine carboxypeptidase/D-alanyl-D-alanine-endopeptidase (penicillin-binding protein 4)
MRAIAAVAVLLTSSGFAQVAPFCAQIQTMLQDSPAHWGISVTALDGTVLCAVNAAQLFRPASNNKLFTTVTALALFGPEQRFYTEVMVGKPPAPTLEGDLTILGDGDAYLSNRRMPYAPAASIPAGTVPPPNPLEHLADQVAKTGIRRITGDVIGEDTVWPYEPYVSTWELEDMVDSDGAPVSALSVVDNTVSVTVMPGATTVDSPVATLDPESNYYQFGMEASTVAAGKPTRIRLEKQPGSRIIAVYGTVALGKSFKDEISIDDPAEFVAQMFRSLLEAHGIEVDGATRAEHRPSYSTESFLHQVDEALQLIPTPKQPALVSTNQPGLPPVIARHVSPTLLDDVTVTLKVSQNLHAELLLHLLGQQFGGDGSTAQGARVIRQFLLQAAKLQPGDFILYDGSGLSSHDLVTPRSLTQLLSYAATQPWFDGFKAALPVGGVDGSLMSRFNGQDQPELKGKVFAKTGSLGESRALSGYLTAASGKTVIFSVMDDNHPPSSTADRTLMDRVVAAIAAAN